MTKLLLSLPGKFFMLFFGVMLFGVTMLTLLNLSVLGFTIANLLNFNLKVVLLEGVVGAAFLQVVALLRLQSTRKMLLDHSRSGARARVYDYQAWQEMVSFPARIFGGMAGFGVVASLIYHLSEILHDRDPFSRMFLIKLACIVCSEQSLSLILAILLFTGSRRILRPYILRIPGRMIDDFSKAAFSTNLLVLFCSLLGIMILNTFLYFFDSLLRAKPPRIGFLIGISFFDIIFGMVIFSLFIRELRDDFKVVIEAMASLGTGSRSQLKTKIPVVANHELGQLALIFNRLQEKMSREYAAIESDLQLACSVQQKLLPEGERIFGAYAAVGICKPCREVGGDFFDIIPFNSHRFLIVTGDVIGKGMPAALMMSAILFLFRNEIRHGGSAAEILNRLNKIVIELGWEGICLALGIAVFDTETHILQYASAGQVAPYVLSRQGPSQLACSSLPLGICLDETYEQIEYTVHPNDTLIFYTDGIIDQFDCKKTSGFDAFERILSSLNDSPYLSVSTQLKTVLTKIESECGSVHDDDKTIVMVRYNG